MSHLLSVMVNPDKKLFHISIHEDTPDNWRSNIGKKKYFSKARYSYDRLKQGKRSTSERRLEAGLAIALINTDPIDWRNPILKARFVKEQAELKKMELVEHYTTNGWDNVGVRNFYTKGNGQSKYPNTWYKKFPESMNFDQISKKIDFINVSLQMDIPKEVRNGLYQLMAGVRSGYEFAQKHNINHDIDNTATLLWAVRLAMGLSY